VKFRRKGSLRLGMTNRIRLRSGGFVSCMSLSLPGAVAPCGAVAFLARRIASRAQSGETKGT